MSTNNPQQGGFNAEDLGEQSIYEDSTQIAQQMRRGDETKGDPNARDTAGATAQQDTQEWRNDRDTTDKETTSAHTGTNDEKRTNNPA